MSYFLAIIEKVYSENKDESSEEAVNFITAFQNRTDYKLFFADSKRI